MYRFGLLVLTILTLGGNSLSARALELTDCRISAGPAYPSLPARCGTMPRPQNPDDPDSSQIELHVVVVPALNLTPKPDPIVPLAGGPGQSAVQFYASYAHAFEIVRRDRDVLLIDQRGTGESARLDCPIDEELIEGQYSVEQTIQYTEDCLETLPYDPRFFTTSIAIQDLDAVREALGYPSLNLYGVSYGTRVAQHYARRFPQATRTIVLDGVVPPQLALGPEIAIEAQRALDNIFARCSADAACDERFPDVAGAFETLKEKLAKKPVKVRLSNPVSGDYERMSFGRDEFAAAIRLLAYHSHTIALMPLLISEAADGNYAPLAAQYQMTVASLSESLAIGMHNTVMCSEDAPFYDNLTIDTQALGASYIGAVQLDALEAICSIWPAGPVDADFKRPLAIDTPTLLLSGSADPITPPAYADIAARNLKRAWLLTLEHQGHGQIAVGCMPRVVERFIDNATLKGIDASCREQAFVMPFFLDFGGPAP